MPNSLDELLKVQDQRSLLYVVREIDGQPAMVRVTPWLPSTGPLSMAALTVPRSAIAIAVPQGVVAEVRGLLYQVVAVTFSADEVGGLLESVFRQLASNLAQQAPTRAAAVTAVPPPEVGDVSIRRDWCGWHWPNHPLDGKE